jgi:hypothetical protein
MKNELRNIKGKPLPYYTIDTARGERELAADLRKEFVPKLARRLPGHHLVGLRHDYMVNFVQRNKKNYPYFVKADIRKFYPSVRHTDLVTGFQVAFRDLLSMKYVPGAFKKKYVRAVNEWTKRLPLTRGIPLGSPLSAVLAPVMLVPLWLEIKRRYQAPLLVFMDDVLVLARTQTECNAIYALMENTLAREYDLAFNPEKVQSGKISAQSIEFCGWRFAGGYATVSEAKIEAFRERIAREFRSCARSPFTALIKRLNRKIDGFGHHYKYGNVGRTYETLDAFIRQGVRKFAAKRPELRGGIRNEDLAGWGLHSLLACYLKTQERAKGPQPKRAPAPPPPASRTTQPPLGPVIEKCLLRQVELTEKLLQQNKEIISLHRRTLQLWKEM